MNKYEKYRQNEWFEYFTDILDNTGMECFKCISGDINIIYQDTQILFFCDWGYEGKTKDMPKNDIVLYVCRNENHPTINLLCEIVVAKKNKKILEEQLIKSAEINELKNQLNHLKRKLKI